MIVASPDFAGDGLMETARLSFVVLVIALANLATDITRLLLELVPPPTLHESVPVQPRPNQQEIPVQPQGAREPDTTQKDIAQKKAKLLDAPGARGPPREPREAAPTRAPFSELPPDFSINHPPWCLVCGQPMRRYVERRRFYQR
jgi:hypothetical protein